MEQMEILKAKLQSLYDIRDKLKPGFEQNFVRDNLQRNFYSSRVVACIEKLFDAYVKAMPGDHENNNSVVKCDRISAYKSSSGWQVYVDMKAIGMTITKRDAEVIVPWLGRAMDSLEEKLAKPKPVIPAQESETGHE